MPALPLPVNKTSHLNQLESSQTNNTPSPPRPPTFTDKHEEREYQKGRLAAAFRIFGKYGFDEGVAGHITLRDPVQPDCFWVNPFGRAFSLITKSDLILVDHSGKVIGGGENRLLNTAAYMIHSAIHEARPDVMCAAHSHSIYGRTFCALGRRLESLTQDSCAFHDDHVLYESFNGVVLAEKEGKDIAACLGGKKAALLQNHGLLTVGGSVEEVSLVDYCSVVVVVVVLLTLTCRPFSGSSRWRSAARASSWLRLPPDREARSLWLLARRRLRTRTVLSDRPRLVGSQRSRCLMLFTRRLAATTWSSMRLSVLEGK